MNEILKELMHEFERPLQNPVLIFSLLLFIILIAPILLKRIKVPGIIGLIISGVIVGPHGVNLLAKTDAIHLFSTIGLLYIMFIAGLEMDLAEFNKKRHKSILFGIFTFFIPIIMGFPVCYYLLGYNFNASVLTASMFATHTLIAYPIVSRLGLGKNEIVAVAVGGTIITDTAVLLILAVIKGNTSPDGLTLDFWLRLLIGLTLFMIIMFLIIPRITKWFFRKLESEKHSHYIFVLSVVFFSAFLSEIAGLEPIIGAFIAGMVLNPLIPHSSALMNRIEYVGNALFIPFFLISVGMLVDLSVLFSSYLTVIAALVLSVTALLGKYTAALLTQFSLRYSSVQRDMLYGLTSARAAASIAIVLVGFELKIIDETLLNSSAVLILITCTIASFVTERAAKKQIIMGAKDNDEKDIKHKEKILLPVANFSNFEKLLDFAILFKNKKSKSSITMLSVVTNDADAEANVAEAQKRIETVKLHASASETKVDFITAIDFNPGYGISRTSREIMANIILLGWPRKKGIIDKLMGEVLEKVLENTDKMVIITNTDGISMAYSIIRVICPPLAELEKNFTLWLNKVDNLAVELSLSIDICSNENTMDSIRKIKDKKSFSANYSFKQMASFENMEEIAEQCTPEEMIILISARPGAVSDNYELDTLPKRMENIFEKNHRLIIIP